MNLFKLVIFKFSLLLILLINSQNFSKVYANDLFFTYAGLNFGYGLNQITYTDWFDTKRETRDVTGQHYNFGLVFNIFIYDFIGDFSYNFTYNNNSDSETAVYHLTATGSLKYAYPATKSFALTIGPGLYIETPPSTKNYDGGGAIISTGFIYTVNWDWKIYTDFYGRYGSYGLGDNSSKISYGITLGFLHKFGKI